MRGQIGAVWLMLDSQLIFFLNATNEGQQSARWWQ